MAIKRPGRWPRMVVIDGDFPAVIGDRTTAFHGPTRFERAFATVGIGDRWRWCIRFVQAYPASAGLRLDPDCDPPWPSVRAAAARLLGHAFAGIILAASYGRVYVDEYQDCNVEQHAVIEALAKHISTRVVGDPLQGIFAFGDQQNGIVSWPRQVCVAFPLDDSKQWGPKRWAANPALGEFVVG
jgi:hypothetical protein